MLLSDRIKNYIPEDWPNKKTPFFLAHGTDDSVVPHDFGKNSAEMAKGLGLENVDFRSYSYVPGCPCLCPRLCSPLSLGILNTLRTRLRLKTWRSSCTRRSLLSLRATYDLVLALEVSSGNLSTASFSG